MFKRRKVPYYFSGVLVVIIVLNLINGYLTKGNAENRYGYANDVIFVFEMLLWLMGVALLGFYWFSKKDK